MVLVILERGARRITVWQPRGRLMSLSDVPAVDGKRPDDEDIQGDDQHAPDRVVGQPHEAQHDAYYRHAEPDHPGSHRTLEQEVAGNDERGTGQQVDPA